MIDERHETVSDIMSEMRKYADSMEQHDLYDLRECATDYLRVLADRIEDAVNRENRTVEKSSAVVNTSAMLEALEKTQSVIATCMEILDKIPDGCDYDGLVDCGAQYKKDAVHADEIVTRFHQMADEVQILVDNITRAIQGISAAVDESAKGVGSAATNTTALVQGMGEIASQMQENKEIAEKLTAEAGKFDRL